MTVLTNATLVLPDALVPGHLSFANGTIEAVAEGHATGENMEGDYLLPGLVELHTDHIEVHVAPRPKVRWNTAAALQAHDAQIAASGITTVFDALRVGVDADQDLQPSDYRDLADGVRAAQSAGRLRASHYLHLRCEVSDPGVLDAYAMFEDVAEVGLISLMDHTPGQRQFASLVAYEVYYKGKSGMSDEAFAAFREERMERAAVWSDRNRRALSARARDRGVVLASHDDATVDHVAEAVRDGATLAEFPTTVQAADAARDAGLRILMGGPNLVRGGSHSNNVSAGALADRDRLDIVSSDYVPFSILQATFVLADRPGWDLPKAVRTVTETPAEVVRLTDRGALAPGRRADVVRVACPNGSNVPVVKAVWREGVRVL